MNALANYLKWMFSSDVDYLDDDQLRAKIRELEKENRILREKLLYGGPLAF